MTDENEDEIEDARFVDGLSEAKADIRVRLEKVLKDTDVQGDVRIRVVRVTNMGEMPVGRVVHEQGDAVDKTVDLILDEAIEDILKGSSGPVTYAMRVLGSDKQTKFELCRKRTRKDDKHPDAGARYLPTEQGMYAINLDVLSRLMEHNDAYAKQIGVAGRREADFAFAMIKNLQEENAMLKKGWFELMRQVEELTQMSFVRRIDAMRFEKENKRKDEVVGMVKQYGPAIVGNALGVPPQLMAMIASKAGGPGGGAGGNVPEIAAWATDFLAFETSLTDDQKAILFQNLQPEQIAPLLRMRERAVAWQKQREQQQRAPKQGGAEKREPGEPERANGRSGYAPYVPEG
jgi:hypothetical protein